MNMGEVSGIVLAPALGFLFGWLLDRSRFNFDKVFRWPYARNSRDWLRSWFVALALVWLAMGVAYFNRWCDVQKLPEVGPLASLLGGAVSGAAIALLGQCPLTISVGAGALSLWALVAFASWMAGLLAGMYTVVALPLERLQAVGLQGYGWQALNDFIGVPRWILLLLAGGVMAGWLMRFAVRVRPGLMEWPKQGALFGIAVVVGWALALKGGAFGGLNLVEAVRDLSSGLGGGALWVRPSLLFALGLGLWGFVRSIRGGGRFFADSVGGWHAVPWLVGAGFLLGLAGVLAKGDPLAHAFFGAGVLQFSSILFVAGMWGAGMIMPRILGEKKGGE